MQSTQSMRQHRTVDRWHLTLAGLMGRPWPALPDPTRRFFSPTPETGLSTKTMPNKRTTSDVKRGRGRPPHVPTAASRRKVAVSAGGGMRHEDIALALGISAPTLLKYYGHELSSGAMERRAEVMIALHQAAKKGSSSAARAYLALTPELHAPPAPAEGDAKPEQPAAPKAAPLGKKEQAQADAATAQQGTEWERLLQPTAPLQ